MGWYMTDTTTALEAHINKPKEVQGSDRRRVENHDLDSTRRALGAVAADQAMASGSGIGIGLAKLRAGDGK